MRSLSARAVPKEQTAETLPTIFIIIKKRAALSTPSSWHFFLLRSMFLCMCGWVCACECEQSEKGVRSLIVLK